MWAVLIILAPVAFAGIVVAVGAFGIVRNAVTSWRLRGLDRFASAHGLAVVQTHGELPDVAGNHALAGAVGRGATVRVVTGTRGGNRFAAFAMVQAVAEVTFGWTTIDLTGLAGRASFTAVVTERDAGGPRDHASLRHSLGAWHVAFDPRSVIAWREGTADVSELAAALEALVTAA